METLAGLVYDRLESPLSLLPRGTWVVLSPGRRVADRAERVATEAAALAEATQWPGAPRPAPGRGRGGPDGAAPVGVQRGGRARPGRVGHGLRERRDGGPARRPGRGRVPNGGRGGGARVARPRAGAGRGAGRGGVGGGGGRGARRCWIRLQHRAPRRGGRGGLLRGAAAHPAQPRVAKRRADALALELEPGDYAVHHVHGVARFGGIVHREIKGSARDFLLLEYGAGDKLYVPADQVGVVAKYLGGEQPRVTKLGSSDWPRAKARVRRAVQEMAGELVRLYSVRMAVPGFAFKPDTPWQRELEDAFPFEETPDQLTAIDDVKRDMEQPLPMDRLVCGDVGYGKTEIAIRAAFKSVMDGKQVAVLVPTTRAGRTALRDVHRALRRLPGSRRDAVAVPSAAGAARGRAGTGLGRHRRGDRDAPAVELRTSSSRTSGCWSSTRSSGSASRTRSA